MFNSIKRQMFNNTVIFFLAQRCINLSNQFLKPFLNKIIYQSALGLHKDAEINRNTDNDPERNDQGWKQNVLGWSNKVQIKSDNAHRQSHVSVFDVPMFLMSRDTPCVKKKKRGQSNQIERK